MNKFSFFYIGSFLILLSVLSFFNIIYSYYFNIFLSVDSYIYTFIICIVLGGTLVFYSKNKYLKSSLFEKILIVLMGYIIFPLIISLPFYLSIYNISFIDCYFEAISGFTSTGFTVFENIKHLDESLILWRSTSQWIGGLYFLFSILLLIDIFDENLKKSLTNYFSLNSSEILKQSFKILIIYLVLTLISFIVLKIINLRTFDAFNLSLTIVSSGGFLPINNFNLLIQDDVSKIVFSILMLALNFNLSFWVSFSISLLRSFIYFLFFFHIVVAVLASWGFQI